MSDHPWIARRLPLELRMVPNKASSVGCMLGGCSEEAKDPINIDMNFAVARALSSYVAQDVVFDF